MTMLQNLWIAYCLVWLSLPSWLSFWHAAASAHANQIPGMLLASFGAFLIPSLWSKTVRVFFLSLAPLAFLTGPLLLYTIQYNAPITVGLLQSIANPDTRVEFEVLNRYWWAFASGAAGVVLYLVALMRIPPIPFSLRKPAVTVALWTILISIYSPYLTFWLWIKYDLSIKDDFLEKPYPQYLFYAVKDWFDIKRLVPVNNKVNIEKKYGLKAPNNSPSSQREVYVLIIGESARERTWNDLEANGFFKVSGVARYHDVLTQANWSRMAVPLITIGAGIPDDKHSLPTITDWQKWSGCVTAALSNNASYRFARAADIKIIWGDEDVVKYNRYDHDLLPMMEALLNSESYRKLCITLHMVGSHQVYTERYDQRFANFDDQAPVKKDAMINAYKNTIVMTHNFVERVIETLARREGKMFLIYTSDHGENLFEINHLQEHVTVTPTEYELKVPLLFWANNQFIQENGKKWSAVLENARLPVSNSNVLPTMLDAMGILPDALKVYDFDASLMEPFVPNTRHYFTPDLSMHMETEMLVDKK
jgi:glucan phosphoethanolaminetransferase (alkaline phosphatase superfamily)